MSITEDIMHPASSAPPWVDHGIPYEGEGGLFSQNWYPICRSTDLAPGQIVARPFLDGRVVAWRTFSGEAHVFSPYCVHLGAGLEAGRVIGSTIECAFHKWRYNVQGRCVQTGLGATPPPRARLFQFPTIDRFGLVWAFNGTTPLWQLPDFAYPDDQLCILTEGPWPIPVDPWVIAGNTYDFSHVELLHGWRYTNAYPDREIVWGAHEIKFPVEFVNHRGQRGKFTFGTLGNNCYFAEGTLDGRWYGYIAPRALPQPGHCELYFILVTHKGAGGPEGEADAREFAKNVLATEMEVGAQDLPILQTLKFRPGYLMAADRQVAKFFDYLRRFPRAHPSGPFIR